MVHNIINCRALYQFLITVASYEISRNLHDDTYGLVFGINTFMALAFQVKFSLLISQDLLLFGHFGARGRLPLEAKIEGPLPSKGLVPR